MKKIQITQKQAQQFNIMLLTLRRIHKDYMNPEQIRRDDLTEHLGFDEHISDAYDNIQQEARHATKGVKVINFPIEEKRL